METAAAIAREVGVKTVELNYQCAEWLCQRLFPDGCPLGRLEVLKQEA